MATEKRQNYQPLPKYNKETVSSSSSTTCTYRITHIKNPAISHERVTEMFSMRKQHIEKSFVTQMFVFVNRTMMVTVQLSVMK
jgi:hypothetical protein